MAEEDISGPQELWPESTEVTGEDSKSLIEVNLSAMLSLTKILFVVESFATSKILGMWNLCRTNI